MMHGKMVGWSILGVPKCSEGDEPSINVQCYVLLLLLLLLLRAT